MHWIAPLVISVTVIGACTKATDLKPSKEEEARAYLKYLDVKVCEGRTELITAEFNYYSNNTDENLDKMEEEQSRSPLFDAKYLQFDWQSFNNSDLLRQAIKYGLLSTQDKNHSVTANKLDTIVGQMTDISFSHNYSICSYKNKTKCGYQGTKDQINAYFNSLDGGERAFYWEENHKYTPRMIRPIFPKYVEISNEYAKTRGFANRADMWLAEYEDPSVTDFECVMRDLWRQIKPLYDQFYSFIRSRLRQRYGEKQIPKSGPIPIQFITFSVGSDINLRFRGASPYPNKTTGDVTDELIKQNYTVEKIMRTVEDFYISMGLEPLPEDFWKNSVFEQSANRDFACDATSYDFYNNKFYRLVMCGSVSFETLQQATHETGHLHAFMGYKDQPCCYRDPASSGLDEGLADAMVVPMTSIKHLVRLGLLSKSTLTDEEAQMNILFKAASNTLTILPYALLLDIWRWNLFKSNIKKENYNTAFWDYRLKFQGFIPPRPRSEEFLDAVDDDLLAQDVQIISYYIQELLEFQFVEALCIAARQYDPENPTSSPLHTCDLYGSKEAGKLLNETYRRGSSEPWTATLKAGTGKGYLDAGAILRYFAPLQKWLEEENKRNGEYIGWRM